MKMNSINPFQPTQTSQGITVRRLASVFAVASTVMLGACATNKAPAPAAATASVPAPKPKEVVINGIAGFHDTPMQPDGKWHVHDPERPQPPIVTPGTFSEKATPPSDAIVLFDGTDLSHWRDPKGNPAPWKIEEGAMVSQKSDIVCTNQFADMQLHIEFCEPTPGKGDGQGRGNSGVFLMGRFEIQVLDCYENKTYADGATAGIYGQHPPLANACRPPGEWQTYDIIFNPPHFAANGDLVSPGYATVFHNGVVAQNHQAIRGDTHWRVPGKYESHDSTGPIALQFHGNSVKYRNIWVRPIAVDNEP